MSQFLRDPSKEEILKIKQDYEKAWKNYNKRLREAEKAGYVIPDKLRLKHVKNPSSQKTIDKLNAITRQKIARTIKLEGGGFYSNQYGEVVPKAEASDIIQIPKPKKHIPYSRAASPNRPLSFKEYIDIALENPENVFQSIAKKRGKGFREDLFLQNEARYNGYLERDPNRPLEPEEREYIINTFSEKGVDITDPYSYGKILDSIRSIYPNYDRYEQLYQEQDSEDPFFQNYFDDIPTEDQQSEPDINWNKELPSEIEPPEKTVSSKLYEMYAYDALYAVVQETTLQSKWAQSNREQLLFELRQLATTTDHRALNTAIVNVVGENAEGFDVEILYKTGALAGFVVKIRTMINQLTSLRDEQIRKEAEDAILSESEDGADYKI